MPGLGQPRPEAGGGNRRVWPAALDRLCCPGGGAVRGVLVRDRAGHLPTQELVSVARGWAAGAEGRNVPGFHQRRVCVGVTGAFLARLISHKPSRFGARERPGGRGTSCLSTVLLPGVAQAEDWTSTPRHTLRPLGRSSRPGPGVEATAMRAGHGAGAPWSPGPLAQPWPLHSPLTLPHPGQR